MLIQQLYFWTLWCKGRLTEADTSTIRLGATPSGLSSAHLHHLPFFYKPDALPAAQPTVSKHWRLPITRIENFVSLDVWFLRHVNVQMDRQTDLLIALLHTPTRSEVKILQSKGSTKKHVLSLRLNDVQSSSGKRFQEAGPEWTWKVPVCLDKNRRNYSEDQSRSLVMALFNNYIPSVAFGYHVSTMH